MRNRNNYVVNERALWVMVKISIVRAVESRRSKSEIGMERVAVDPRLEAVETVSLDILSLLQK